MVFVCFGRQKNLKSWLVRLATDSEWSHVWIEFELAKNVWAIHSASDGVVMVPADRVRAEYAPVETVPLDVPVDVLLWEAHKFVGADYDFNVIINGILLALWRATGVIWFRPLRNACKYSCSEVTILLLKRHVKALAALDAELTTPGKLLEALSG